MPPIEKSGAGSVSCALWENEVSTANGRTVPILKATIDRRYKDKGGQWKSSNSFGRNEIPLAQYVLGKAFEAMIGEKQSDDICDARPYRTLPVYHTEDANRPLLWPPSCPM